MKEALQNLKSITVFYDGSGPTGPMAPRVDIVFNDAENAESFWRKLNSGQRDYLVGSEFFMANFPRPENWESPELTKVGLSTGFDVTNFGRRANEILNFLDAHFELPTTIYVSYPDIYSPSYRPGADYIIISLPFTLRDLVAEPLTQFFQKRLDMINQDIAIKQSELQANLSTLIGERPVLVRLIQAKNSLTSLEISCECRDDVRELKYRLYSVAIDKNADTDFHFEKILDVAGTCYQDRFILKANPGVDFHVLLEGLVALSTMANPNPPAAQPIAVG